MLVNMLIIHSWGKWQHYYAVPSPLYTRGDGLDTCVCDGLVPVCVMAWYLWVMAWYLWVMAWIPVCVMAWYLWV